MRRRSLLQCSRRLLWCRCRCWCRRRSRLRRRCRHFATRRRGLGRSRPTENTIDPTFLAPLTAVPMVLHDYESSNDNQHYKNQPHALTLRFFPRQLDEGIGNRRGRRQGRPLAYLPLLRGRYRRPKPFGGNCPAAIARHLARRDRLLAPSRSRRNRRVWHCPRQAAPRKWRRAS
jgi:hypothetical protein